MVYIVYILCALTLVLSSCTPRKQNQAIIETSLIISNNVTLATSILENIDVQKLSKEDRAKYGILLSMAYQRGGKIIMNDSIIAPSLRYYKDRNNVKQFALSQFFYGDVMRNIDSIKLATESYLNVISVLPSLPKDSILLKLKATSFQELASIYFEQEYFSESLKYFQKSAELFDLISKDKSQKIRYMEANTYTRMGNITRGAELFDSLYNATPDPEFKLWLKLTTLQKAILDKNSIYSIEELIQMHKQIDLDILNATPTSDEWSASPIFMYNTISALLAYRCGKVEKAYEYIELSINDLGDITPLNIGYYITASEISRAAGKMGAALSYQRLYTVKKDSLNTLLREQQVKQIEKEYHNKKNNEVKLLKMRYQIHLFAIIGVAFLISVLMLTKLYKRRIATQRREIEEYLAIAESYKQSNNVIMQQLHESNVREKTIKEYLSSRKDMMQQIAKAYYMYGDEKKFSEKMRDMALSQEMLSDLIELVNFYTDGVISRLKSEFPL
ncbi:MAG: hypothetical protein ACRC8J_00650, partial [Phocaeicola sp.]